MSLFDRLADRMSSKFGRGCAKAMLSSFNAARRRFPDAPESASLIEAVSSRRSWSVDLGGPLTYKGGATGHVVDDKMTLPELIYIVISVELAVRLSPAEFGAAIESLTGANEYLTAEGLDESRSVIELPDKFKRWAGSFW